MRVARTRLVSVPRVLHDGQLSSDFLTDVSLCRRIAGNAVPFGDTLRSMRSPVYGGMVSNDKGLAMTGCIE